MLKKIVLISSGLSITTGLILMIGTAGSLDLNCISLKAGLIQSIVSLILILCGSVGFSKNPIYIEWD